MESPHPEVSAERERIDQLEKIILDLQDRDRATQNTIKHLLSNQNPENSQAKPRNPRAEHSASPKMPRTARPAVPPDFDGDRAKGTAFLNACQTYLRLCPREFPDEQTKIVWAMSYMKSGRAQRWTARIFRWETLEENEGCAKFVDWADFRDEFRQEFTPAHADSHALNKLEMSGYYQKSRPLNDYIDEFLDLITDSGYTDSKTVVVKFRRGLNSQIQNVVATMGVGRPADTDPQGWYDMARTVDQNRATNEAFTSSSRSSAPTPSRSLGMPIGRSILPSPLPARHAHSVPTPGHPVPMDIDTARKKSASDATCHRCGKPGHWSKNCPDRYDIRVMSNEEIEEELEGRFARLDAVDERPVRLVEPTPAEDFPQDNE
jgi:hypothetical protein